MPQTDTIAAIATPPGRGGVGIVRVSGPAAFRYADAIAGRGPAARTAALRQFRDSTGEIIDYGLVIRFPGPASYTGEDVVEFHGHGTPVVLDALIAQLLELGARMARPGEFSERAFLNERLDLVQAEAVADLIDSGSRAAARAAMRSLQGEFSAAVHELVQTLTEVRVLVEAAIDFPEEEIDVLTDYQVRERLEALDARFCALRGKARQGVLLREGMTLVLAGAPNVGKSSLLNRLAGHDAAIVTDIPGTTRDVLRQTLDLDGLPLHVIDTAGLRESDDPIELEGVRRAREQIARADIVLLVVDDSSDPDGAETTVGASLPEGPLRLTVRNKIDLTDTPPGALAEIRGRGFAVSALTDAGMAELRDGLKSVVGFSADAGGVFAARRRHLDAIARAYEALARAREQVRTGAQLDMIAEELRLAQAALGEITGAVTSEDLLGEIFSSFCIGK